MSRCASVAKILTLHKRVAQLKRLKRRGWVSRGVPEPESVAEHGFGVAVLAMVMAADQGLSVERAVVLALLHEFCETLVGDIIPADGVQAVDKRAREEAASREVLNEIDPSGQLFELWLDFEDQRSPEGRLVRQLDRLEMALQAREYEVETGLDLTEFYRSTRESLDQPLLLSILAQLENEIRPIDE